MKTIFSRSKIQKRVCNCLEDCIRGTKLSSAISADYWKTFSNVGLLKVKELRYADVENLLLGTDLMES